MGGDPNQYKFAPANYSNDYILFNQTARWYVNVVGRDHKYAIIYWVNIRKLNDSKNWNQMHSYPISLKLLYSKVYF